MAKDLPYFKFFCSEWSDGDITLEDYEIQGVFINVCAYYWSNECSVSKEKLLKKFKSVSEQINILFASKIIKENSNEVVISFLNEQWFERSRVSEQNSKTAREMWERKRKESERNANAYDAQCESDANKRREEEIRKEKMSTYQKFDGDELVLLCMGNENWILEVERIYKVERTKILFALNEFKSHRITTGKDEPTTIKEFKSHFTNWVRKKKQYQVKE